jgi:filamentous hemagglutinin
VHNINGRITGDAVAVAALNDINVTGGTIDAASSLTAIAGRDINVTTTTSSATDC